MRKRTATYGRFCRITELCVILNTLHGEGMRKTNLDDGWRRNLAGGFVGTGIACWMMVSQAVGRGVARSIVYVLSDERSHLRQPTIMQGIHISLPKVSACGFKM